MIFGFLVLLLCLIVGVRHGGIGLAVVKLPKEHYWAMFIFFAGIAIIAFLGNNPQLIPHFPVGDKMKPVSMTVIIQMIMLVLASLMLFFCKAKAKDVGDSTVRGAHFRLRCCLDGGHIF